MSFLVFYEKKAGGKKLLKHAKASKLNLLISIPISAVVMPFIRSTVTLVITGDAAGAASCLILQES